MTGIIHNCHGTACFLIALGLKQQEVDRQCPEYPVSHGWLWRWCQRSPSSGASPALDHPSSVFSAALLGCAPAALLDLPVLSWRFFCRAHWGQGGGSRAGSSHTEPPFSPGPSHPATGVFAAERGAGLERGGAEGGEPNEGSERPEREVGWIGPGIHRKSYP